jgi:hypothetical protein
VDMVHGAMDIFYGIVFRKINPKIQQSLEPRNFAKTQ